MDFEAVFHDPETMMCEGLLPSTKISAKGVAWPSSASDRSFRDVSTLTLRFIDFEQFSSRFAHMWLEIDPI